MRPTSAEALMNPAVRPRKHSTTESASASSSPGEQTPLMTYFLADQATVSAATASAGLSASSSSSPSGDFGVRSLEASVEDVDLRKSSRRSSASSHRASSGGKAGNRGTGSSYEPVQVHHDMHDEDEKDEEDEDSENEDQDELDALDSHSIASLQSSTNHEYTSVSPQPILSQPLTPIMCPSLDTPGSPGTPKSGDWPPYRTNSRRESETVAERGSPAGSVRSEKLKETMDAPQLIMPEITMPSRRPFTERGKRINRLKVLIAGDSGIGKTSLIKSIVQTCEDIVHVDPLGSSAGAGSKHSISSFSSHGRRSDSGDCTKQITEVYASTRPYPHWWSEINESKVLRRRKSRAGMEEQVIERNLCFVDTPGYGSGTSFLECIEPVVRYVEAQFERTRAIVDNGDGDLMSLLTGSGMPHVDVVFYVILHRLKPVDVEFIRRLSPYTNVLPVIAKSDTMTPSQIANLKLSILNELRMAGIRPFLFGKSSTDIVRAKELAEAVPPFAISSIVASDAENMDASVLMSPEYVPPLVDTELKELVDRIFDPDNIAWLRHAAIKKYMQWKTSLSASSLVTARGVGLPGSPGRPTTPTHRGSASASGLLSTSSLMNIPGPESFAMARVADHTQREERLAKVRLSRWAHDLQRSLEAERERYERLARGERAIWLTERLGECIVDGQLVPVSSLGGTISSASREGQQCLDGAVGMDARDPFGILRFNEVVLSKAALMAKIAGLGGLMGVVGVWIFKQWSPEWMMASQMQGR